MKPFSIRCTTCQAGLVVRNAEAIGQILACPKCDSMVLVEAPSSSVSEAPASAAVDTQDTVADSTFEDAAAMFSDAAIPRDANEQRPAAEQREVTHAPPAEHATAKPSAEPSSEADATEPSHTEISEVDGDVASAPVESTDQGTALPAADWTSSSTLQLKQYLLAGAAGITGILVALGAIVYFVSGGSGATDPDAPTVAVADADNLSETASETVATETTSDDSALATDGIAETTPQQTSDVSDPTTETVSNVDPVEAADGNADADVEGNADAEGPEPAPEAGVPSDPLPLPAPEEAQPTEKPQDDGADEPLGPEDLLVEGSFLDENVTPETTTQTPEESVKPTAGPTAVENKIAGQPKPAERDIDVPTQLAVRLPAIELKDTSLADFLSVMERLTTVPITVDLEALAWARVNLDTPISVNLQDASIEEILQSALGTIRLGHVVEADDVLVTVMNRKDALRQHRFAVDDLMGDDAAEGKALMSTIQRFVKPDTWAIHGGTATLTLDGQELAVSQTDQGILDVLLFLEQLRVARGLGQQSKYPHELLQVESPTLLAVPAISQRVSLNFSQPTPLADILRRLGDDVGMRIVVDWRTAGQLGWSPATTTTLVVEEKTLQDSLNALLRPLNLGFRIINSRTMQITTAERVTRKRQLEMYPLPVSNNMTAAQAAKQLHHAGGLNDEAQENTYFDPTSGYLLAWLTQAEQIELARAVHAMQP